MLLVLVARTQSGRRRPLERPEQLLLGLQILEDRLDHDIGVRRLRHRPRRRSVARGRLCRASGVWKSARKQLVGPGQGRLDVLHLPVLQRDREALQRAPGGDIAAHDTGADDMDVAHWRLRAGRPGVFSRSCRKNTRTRLRDVAVTARRAERARLRFVGCLARGAVIAATGRSWRTGPGSDRVGLACASGSRRESATMPRATGSDSTASMSGRPRAGLGRDSSSTASRRQASR